MLNWKEPSIYFESITKVRLLPFHTHTRIPFQPRCATESTEPFPIWSKVSQKLDYVVSTHTRIPSQPRCVTESIELVLDVVTSKKTKLNRSPSQPRESNFCDTFEDWIPRNHTQNSDLVHITKGKFEFNPTMLKRLNWFTSQKQAPNSAMNYEWWMMNQEWWMMNEDCLLRNAQLKRAINLFRKYHKS